MDKSTNENNLLDYLNENSTFVSPQEQKEFDALNIDFNNLEGEDLSSEEVLNS